MTQYTQTGLERRGLRSRAQTLAASVRVGQHGIDPVLANVETALQHHHLVKVRFDGLKEQKQELALSLAEKLNAELIQVIGHNAVLYRP
ncbi:MAG: YhbY family RNA-binding protein [Candidatus Methylacidiphilales bacterium]|nr:YhbY family RNA-binding protein [Candidatus Methylacidiphilales bacterium]